MGPLFTGTLFIGDWIDDGGLFVFKMEFELADGSEDELVFAWNSWEVDVFIKLSVWLKEAGVCLSVFETLLFMLCCDWTCVCEWVNCWGVEFWFKELFNEDDDVFIDWFDDNELLNINDAPVFVDRTGAVAGEFVLVRRFESDKFEWNNLAPDEAGREFDKLNCCDANGGGGGVPLALFKVNGDLFIKLAAVCCCNSCENLVWARTVEPIWGPVCTSGCGGTILALFAMFVGVVIGGDVNGEVKPAPVPFKSGGLFSGICKTELSDGGLMSALLNVAEFNCGLFKSAVGDGVAKLPVVFKIFGWFKSAE